MSVHKCRAEMMKEANKGEGSGSAEKGIRDLIDKYHKTGKVGNISKDHIAKARKMALSMMAKKGNY